MIDKPPKALHVAAALHHLGARDHGLLRCVEVVAYTHAEIELVGRCLPYDDQRHRAVIALDPRRHTALALRLRFADGRCRLTPATPLCACRCHGLALVRFDAMQCASSWCFGPDDDMRSVSSRDLEGEWDAEAKKSTAGVDPSTFHMPPGRLSKQVPDWLGQAMAGGNGEAPPKPVTSDQRDADVKPKAMAKLTASGSSNVMEAPAQGGGTSGSQALVAGDQRPTARIAAETPASGGEGGSGGSRDGGEGRTAVSRDGGGEGRMSGTRNGGGEGRTTASRDSSGEGRTAISRDSGGEARVAVSRDTGREGRSTSMSPPPPRHDVQGTPLPGNSRNGAGSDSRAASDPQGSREAPRAPASTPSQLPERPRAPTPALPSQPPRVTLPASPGRQTAQAADPRRSAQ